MSQVLNFNCYVLSFHLFYYWQVIDKRQRTQREELLFVGPLKLYEGSNLRTFKHQLIYSSLSSLS